MMLADAAQVSEGKLYILGGGWSVAGVGPLSVAIAIKFEVPWDLTNRPHKWHLALVEEDGAPVRLKLSEDAEATVEVDGAFEVGRPTGLKPGTPMDMPVAINLQLPVALEPDRRYQWRLTVNDDTREEWQIGFTTRK
jgi:hypothetical protein